MSSVLSHGVRTCRVYLCSVCECIGFLSQNWPQCSESLAKIAHMFFVNISHHRVACCCVTRSGYSMEMMFRIVIGIFEFLWYESIWANHLSTRLCY